MEPARPVPVAVVGISALFPGSIDAPGFWRDIVSGRDLVTDVPATHWLIEDYYDPDPEALDKTYAKRGAFIRDVPFDPMEWGVPPSIVPATDTTQLLSLILAKAALDDASGGRSAEMNKERMSVILGVTGAQELLGTMVSRLQKPAWVKGLREAGLPEDDVQRAAERIAAQYVPWQESSFPGLLGNVVAGRIANRLDLGGTNCVTDAACASSFSALSMALNELYLGQADVVLTGGCDTMNDIFMYLCFSKTPALSPSGDCRPFSDKADGTLLGEGIGLFALKRLSDAERDGNAIYAVIRAVGASSDGRAKSVYAPVPQGQEKALRRTYEMAGYGPETVELVEAHGTGTKAGDAAEFEGLRLAFDASGRTDRQWCALGSVKSQIGHTKAAAGAAGLFKAVMALHHRVLPPTAKVDRPNPKLALGESPFHLNTTARPWIRADDHPRRASVSSFGFGGSNFHVAVEEYTGPSRPGRGRFGPDELVVITGATPDAVAAAAQAMVARAHEEGQLRRLAWETAQQADLSQPARLAIVATDEADLREKLQAGARAALSSPQAHLPNGISWQMGGDTGRIAFLFPGQGSQYVGMGADLAMAYDTVRAPFDDAAGALGLHHIIWPRSAFDDVVRGAQDEALRATEVAQPALGLLSLAMADMLAKLGLTADATAGHSYGEVSALVAAGVLAREDLSRVSRARGERMRDAGRSTPGAMLAVPRPVHDVQHALGNGVVVANINAPKQTVLSGPRDAIEALAKRLGDQGIECKRLPVATAFHSAIVAPAVDAFANDLADVTFSPPKLPVWSNPTGAAHSSDPSAIRSALASQLGAPVQWVETIRSMAEAGVRTFVEVGAGSVLTNLVGEILEGREHVAVAMDRRKRNGLTSLHHALARLVTAGAPLRLAALWEGYSEPLDVAGRAKPKLQLAINGSNYGKPYPPPGGAAALPKPNPPRPLPAPKVVERIVHVPSPVAQAAPSPFPAATAAAFPTQGADPMADPSWLAAFHETQRATAEAHAAFQRAMAEAHLGFLRTMEASLGGLGAAAGAPPYVAAPPAWPTQAPSWPATPPPTWQAPAPQAIAAAPAWPPAQSWAPPPPPAPPPVIATAPAPAMAPLVQNGADVVRPPILPTPISAHAAPVAAAPVDLTKLLLDVVSQKTGYPAEMLAMHMTLEADLGVDSIKRVEILSALRERAPGLPEVDPSEMAKLVTLGQIVDRLGSAAPAPATTIAAPSSAAVADLPKLLLEVVSAKTGYPAEMLAMHMTLEADLGVDSIKRVEILSALRERAPGLPEVDPSEMAKLTTLGQIVERLGNVAVVAATPSAPTGVAATPSAGPVPRWGLEFVSTPPSGLGLAGLTGDVLVTGHPTVGPALAAALASRGLRARYVVQAEPADALVALHGLGDGDLPTATAAMEGAFLAAQTVAPRLTAGGAFVGVQDTGGRFAPSLERAWWGGLSGLVKTAMLEWPGPCKVIDLERAGRSDDALATAIADELTQGGADLEVGLPAAGARGTLRSVVRTVAADLEGLTPKDVVVASGGARGVTARCLIEAARASRAKFVLLGRTALAAETAAVAAARTDAEIQATLLAAARERGEMPRPADLKRAVAAIRAGRDVRETLAAIAKAGGEARYEAADASDVRAVSAALDRVRAEWGPVTAIVHGAGVLADRKITDLSLDAWRSVYDTKVRGLHTLLAATQADPIRWVLNFGSIAGRCGNVGQAAYSAANEVLSRAAAALDNGAGRRARCLAWGPWRGGMVDAGLEAHFKAMGVTLVDLDAGARAFVAELRDGSSGTEVVLGTEPSAGAIAGGPPRPTRFSVHTSQASHPYLRGHVIRDVPVVPVTLVMEWFARAAAGCRPDRHMMRLSDIAVRRGIQLSHFENGGDWFEIVATPKGDAMGLELRNAAGAVHYAATAEYGEAGSAPSATAAPSVPAWSGRTVYDGDVLFHGDGFRVIRDVDGVGTAGAVGTLDGLVAAGWGAGPWRSDPAALDGGLQLALLWGREVLGGATLPMSVGAWKRYESGPAEGPWRAVLRAVRHGRDKAVADIAFETADGRVHSELHGVEVILRPGAAAR